MTDLPNRELLSEYHWCRWCKQVMRGFRTVNGFWSCCFECMGTSGKRHDDTDCLLICESSDENAALALIVRFWKMEEG